MPFNPPSSIGSAVLEGVTQHLEAATEGENFRWPDFWPGNTPGKVHAGVYPVRMDLDFNLSKKHILNAFVIRLSTMPGDVKDTHFTLMDWQDFILGAMQKLIRDGGPIGQFRGVTLGKGQVNLNVSGSSEIGAQIKPGGPGQPGVSIIRLQMPYQFSVDKSYEPQFMLMGAMATNI